LHDPERTLRATPGQHCIYCPKLGKSCPMAESNPWGEMSPMERAQFAKWIDEARKENLEKLKQFCIEDGPIVFTDANGVEYVAKHFETADKSYPLAPASRVLKSYIEANPKDHAFFENLTVGGLSSPLKAKFRSSLAQQMLEIAEVKKGTEFGVKKVKEK
jgi:Fe-S oxidoreductase